MLASFYRGTAIAETPNYPQSLHYPQDFPKRSLPFMRAGQVEIHAVLVVRFGSGGNVEIR
jgi:hypothetical protein